MSLKSIAKLVLESVGLRKRPPLLRVSTPAPDFRCADQNGVMHSLAEQRGKRVVLWFYPKASTPGCTREACGFRDRFPDFQGKGVVVWGVSFDNAEDNRKFAQQQGFTYPLLCDTSRAIGLAYKACDAPTDSYARRYTYVIGADGKIEHAIITQDPGAQAAELLAKLA